MCIRDSMHTCEYARPRRRANSAERPCAHVRGSCARLARSTWRVRRTCTHARVRVCMRARAQTAPHDSAHLRRGEEGIDFIKVLVELLHRGAHDLRRRARCHISPCLCASAASREQASHRRPSAPARCGRGRSAAARTCSGACSPGCRPEKRRRTTTRNRVDPAGACGSANTRPDTR